MNRERIDDLINILGTDFAELENTFVIKNNQQLCNYLDSPEKWVAKQRANQNKYRRVLVKEARQQLKRLNAKAERIFLLSYKEVAKDQIEITEKEIIAKNIPQSVKDQIKQMKDFNAEQVSQLANQTLLSYSRQVQLVNALSTPDTLYDEVKRQMRQGIQNGIKITYSNGRQVSWKAYMEMNIRTTIHQEIANSQIETGANVGQIFYICDSFADCADDHKAFQGKIYFNNKVNIPTEIGAWIQRHNIQSMQEVMENKPWLTTRPNCRHNFHAIPLDEAMGMDAQKILNKYGFSKGKYKGSNYEKLQEQRRNERMIRKFKLEKEDNEQLAKTTNDKSFIKKARYDEMKIKEWQARQRTLIKNNPNLLKRDYDRENIKVITQDLGVRYDYKFVNGEPVKK